MRKIAVLAVLLIAACNGANRGEDKDADGFLVGATQLSTGDSVVLILRGDNHDYCRTDAIMAREERNVRYDLRKCAPSKVRAQQLFSRKSRQASD